MKRSKAPGAPAAFELRRSHLALAISAAIFGLVSSAEASVLTVDDLGDGAEGCTLRNALRSADEDQAFGGCSAGLGFDLIFFDPSLLPGTITLTGGTIPIRSEVYLGGPGADQLTISGDGSSPLFRVSDDSATEMFVEISGVTLAGGGGGGLGGALRNFEELSIVDSVLSGNEALYGGAIDNRGALTIEGSTLSGNTATGRGGAIADYGTRLEVRNSTISGNSAPLAGGIVTASASASLTNVTITANSAAAIGGLWAPSGAARVLNSVLADNQDFDCADADSSGALNLIGTGNCDAPLTGPALLGSLEDNGGRTPTHALLDGSPAIDAGDVSICPELDQRGVARLDGLCDLGAFEFRPPPIVVDSELDVVADDGLCSLREAIGSANLDQASGTLPGECIAGRGPDRIEFALPPFERIVLQTGELRIQSVLTIEGGPTASREIRADGSFRIFRIDDQDSAVLSPVTFRKLTLRGGEASFGGGAIQNDESLQLESVTLVGNSTSGDGGAILNRGTLTAVSSQLWFNHADGAGGAIHGSLGSTTHLDRSSITHNTAGLGGGGLHALGSMALTNSTVSTNTAASGGGIESAGGRLSLFATTVADNSAAAGNAGVHNVAGALSLYNNILGNNRPAGDCVNTGEIGYINFNLVSDGSCNANRQGDPRLAPLSTDAAGLQSHRLLPGSGAIDVGGPLACDPGDVDQRGAPRLADGDGNGSVRCDLGALEMAAPIMVTTAVDQVADDGACSLREALAAAADDTAGPDASGACAAGGGLIADAIQFDLPPATTLTLAGAALPVRSAVIIGGPGAEWLTVSGDGRSGIFAVGGAYHEGTIISGLTLTGGVSEAGGAIGHDGPPLLLDRLLIAGNSANFGGGIAVSASGNISQLTILDSTIHDNTAEFQGGGIFSSAGVALRNSTISGNQADTGGGIAGTEYSTTVIDHGTITSNAASTGAGLFVDSYDGYYGSLTGGLTLRNSVVAGNAGGGADCEHPEAPTVLASLVEDGSCGAPLAGDPMLGPLADNGGPTPTRAPLDGSALIDGADDPACLARDQRGVARPIDGDELDGAACDIGAIEYRGRDALFDDGFEGDDPPGPLP